MSDQKSEQAKAAGSSATITIACKLPHGLILRLFKMVPVTEPVLGGGTRETTIAESIGDQVRINGYARPYNARRGPEVLGGENEDVGFALTHGVKRDFFEEWLSQNQDLDIVRKGLIFATSSYDDAKKKAADHTKVRNGLEPLDPAKLPRLSRNMRVETAVKEEAA